MLLCALRSAPLHKTLAEVSGVPAQKWNGIYRIPPAFFELVEVQGPAETNHNHNLCGSCGQQIIQTHAQECANIPKLLRNCRWNEQSEFLKLSVLHIQITMEPN